MITQSTIPARGYCPPPFTLWTKDSRVYIFIYEVILLKIRTSLISIRASSDKPIPFGHLQKNKEEDLPI
jgi:hypothetical protein